MVFITLYILLVIYTSYLKHTISYLPPTNTMLEELLISDAFTSIDSIGELLDADTALRLNDDGRFIVMSKCGRYYIRGTFDYHIQMRYEYNVHTELYRVKPTVVPTPYAFCCYNLNRQGYKEKYVSMIVMQALKGVSLKEVTKRCILEPNIAVKAVSQVIYQLLELQYLSEFTHYDLHSSNVILIKGPYKETVYQISQEETVKVISPWTVTFIDFETSRIKGVEEGVIALHVGHLYAGVVPPVFDSIYDITKVITCFLYDVYDYKHFPKTCTILKDMHIYGHSANLIIGHTIGSEYHPSYSLYDNGMCPMWKNFLYVKASEVTSWTINYRQFYTGKEFTMNAIAMKQEAMAERKHTRDEVVATFLHESSNYLAPDILLTADTFI